MTDFDPFTFLADAFRRPPLFGEYTADRLWQDEYISERMLELHLDDSIELASRPRAFLDRSAAWIRTRFRIGEKTVVFDYGCGPGLYAARFARMGAQVTGIDFSRRSIDHATRYADENRLEVNYVWDDYLRWETEDTADLITLIYCDLCALSPQKRGVLFDKFRRHVKPGGYILLDVCSLAGFERVEQRTLCEPNLLDGFFSPEDYFGLLASFKYDTDRVTLDKYTIVQRHDVRHFYNWLQHYSVESLTAELAANGFAVHDVHANVAGDPYQTDGPIIAVVAQAI